MTDAVALPDPWFVPETVWAEALTAEAVREIGQSHALFGRRLTVVAKCGGCDRVLFRLDDESWAIVHLTWTSSPPDTPPFPRFTQFGSFIAVEMGVDSHSAEAHRD